MSRLFTYNGHIMLYIISMRMHAFAGSRIIESTYIGYGVVLLVIVALTYLAFRNRTQVLAVITWIMAMVTAIYSPSIHLMLLLMVGVTGTSIFFTSRYGWWTGLIISIVLVYCTFLIWITGNPVVNGSFEIITDHQYGYIYLFTCALAYSFMAMLPKSDRVPGNFLTAGIILNGLGFSFILTIAVLSFFSDNYFIYLGLIAAFSMASNPGKLETHCRYVRHIQLCGAKYNHRRDLQIPPGIFPAVHSKFAGGINGSLVSLQIHCNHEHPPFHWITDRLPGYSKYTHKHRFRICLRCSGYGKDHELEKNQA